MDVFPLQIQVAGQPHHANATADGAAITIATDASLLSARTVREAVRAAAGYLAPFLRTAARNKLPWGLYVSVAGVAAAYGDWPRFPGPPATDRTRDELVTRIRREYHDESSASAALENATRIFAAYTQQRRAA
jgi:hypothetical protein